MTKGRMITGHTHWIANGILYAHSVSLPRKPRRMPAAMSWPYNQVNIKYVQRDGWQTHHDPAEIHISGEVRAQRGGTNLRGIGDREGLEDTPRDALQNGSGNENTGARCEERNEDEGDHHEEGQQHGFLVSNPIGDDTIKVQSEDGTDLMLVSNIVYQTGTGNHSPERRRGFHSATRYQ